VIEGFLRLANLEVRRISRDRRENRIYPDWKHLFHYSQIPAEVQFYIPVDRCIDVLGFPFSGTDRDVLHPYSQAVREILADETAAYVDSWLRRYYGVYQPSCGADLFPEAKTLENYPPDTHLIPWLPLEGRLSFRQRTDRLGREYRDVRSPSNPLFGPMDDTQGNAEYVRLGQIVRSIRQKGFLSSHDRKNDITGVLLRRDDDVRFVVLGGKHRTAAVGVITPTAMIPVRLRRPIPFEERDVEVWPLVDSGIWSREAALAYFDRLFERKGAFEY